MFHNLTFLSMHTLNDRLHTLQREQRLGLMTHIVAGCPDIETNELMLKAMARAGANFIEIQIPFSDPLADGPTLMRANQEALHNKVTTRDAFMLMARAAERLPMPLLFMTYYNVVFKYGAERFMQDAAQAGCAGVIIPDIPHEVAEREGLLTASRRHGVPFIGVAAPVTADTRLEKIAAHAEGFLYLAGRQGTTGVQTDFDSGILRTVRNVKNVVDLPVAVGFGISRPEHVRSLRDTADIAVVGSAILECYRRATGDKIAAVEAFVRGLRQAAG